MNKDYGKAFRIVRAALGLKQTELAELLSITPSYLSLIEANKRLPSTAVIDGFAKGVGIPSALIAVLASSSDELADSSEDTFGDLAKALLRLLISTKADAQQQLAFGEK